MVSGDRAKYRAAVEAQRVERELATATPVPYRITKALDFHGLDGPEVDVALGGVEPMVDEWEAGIRVPTREQIERLAELTDFPVRYFYEPAPELEGPMWVCFRRGPKGKRCQQILPPDPAPPAEPVAAVVPLRPAGWRCLISGCPTRGRRQPVERGADPGAAFRDHFLDCHHRPPTPGRTS